MINDTIFFFRVKNELILQSVQITMDFQMNNRESNEQIFTLDGNKFCIITPTPTNFASAAWVVVGQRSNNLPKWRELFGIQ